MVAEEEKEEESMDLLLYFLDFRFDYLDLDSAFFSRKEGGKALINIIDFLVCFLFCGGNQISSKS